MRKNTAEPFCEINLDELRARASRTLSNSPRPFLKWAGSKRSLLCHIVESLPPNFRTYHEPFLGSGSLFFLLCPPRAVLSDACTELVEAFRAIRDDFGRVRKYLEPLKPQREIYYGIRENRSKGRFNGLYRVNSAGKFNVPFGLVKSENLVDWNNLRECSRALRRGGVSIQACDFERNLEDVQSGDLVYLDPPYVTGHNNNGFIDYNERLFSWADQLRLAKLAGELVARGAHVIVSNADHEEVVRLYPGFLVHSFERPSTLASSPLKRGRVSEVILSCLGARN
jgi:DNA adenine methylase